MVVSSNRRGDFPMHLQLAMGFGLEFNCPAELEDSYALPPNLFAFWHTVEPIMRAIMDHHPNRDPDSPEGLLWEFQRYLLVVPEVKNRWQRWQPSTAASASPRPIPNLPYWQHYDPAEPGQVPYVTWFLRHFSDYITRIGLF
jgi:hypothetical protein